MTRSEFSNLCRDTLNCTDEDAAVIFDQVDTQQNGQITLSKSILYISSFWVNFQVHVTHKYYGS